MIIYEVNLYYDQHSEEDEVRWFYPTKKEAMTVAKEYEKKGRCYQVEVEEVRIISVNSRKDVCLLLNQRQFAKSRKLIYKWTEEEL